MSEDLKPCPFCGELPASFGYGNHTHCIECMCEVTPHVEITGTEKARLRAITLWNTRHVDDTNVVKMEARIEELEALLRSGIENAESVVCNMRDIEPHGFCVKDEKAWINQAKTALKKGE